MTLIWRRLISDGGSEHTTSSRLDRLARFQTDYEQERGCRGPPRIAHCTFLRRTHGRVALVIFWSIFRFICIGSMSPSDVHEFFPAKFLSHSTRSEDATCPSLLILNQPIAHFDAFSRLWAHSSYRICADGGANRLFDMFRGNLAGLKEQYVGIFSTDSKWMYMPDTLQLPDVVHGDLDSLRDDVRDYYAAHGVEISRDKDQDSTDFGKTMQKISTRVAPTALQDVIVLGTLGGRVDQGLGLLHEMIREEAKHSNLRLWLFSESSVSFNLKRRHNVIRGLQSSGIFTENVGIVPMYGAATITTSGLEWDVCAWYTQIGGQVSTSNHVRADEVRVETDATVLFTIERAALESQ